jgi:hypothetical protein
VGGQKSVLLSTLLMISGTAVALNAIIASRNFFILIFSEPIIEAILGIVLLHVGGIAKSLSPATNIKTEAKISR